MMKCIVFVLVIAAVATAYPQDHYTDRYDNVNVDEILGNRRLLIPYMKCMLDQGRCSAEGKELKSHIQEALETYCEKCSPIQREKTRQVMGHLVNHEPDYWNQLVSKYDPNRVYTRKYEQELRQIQH